MPTEGFSRAFESLENREFPSKNMGAAQVAQWHGSALGAEFDHSPMAPPMSIQVITAGRLLGPGTLEKGWVRPKQAWVGI